MKLDKETIVKHQFWFLLGTYLLVWLIAVLWLKFAAADPIEQAKKTYKDSSEKLKRNSQDPKNPNTFCPPWEEYAGVFNGHKQVIWKAAWDYQKPMFTWPEYFDSKISALGANSSPRTNGRRPTSSSSSGTLYNEEMDDLETAAVGKKKDKNAQGFLTPIELEGGFEAIMKPLKWTEIPTREECWLAQEDFWVRRELLWDLACAVAYQAYMVPVPIDDKKEPLPPDVVSRLRYRNQSWEITLLIKEDKEKKQLVISRDSTIKNVHPGGRTLPLASAKGEGIVFNVYQEKAYSRFELKGEPVPSEGLVPFGYDYPLRDIQWKDKNNPVFMSQAFDWYTCPIRRIEALEIGQQSCRTFTTALKANETLSKLDPPREAPADPNASKDATNTMGMGGGTGPSGGNPMMRGMMGGMSMMGGAAGATPPNTTPNNNMDRERYLQAPKEGESPEKPSRHLPIALALIVDQSNMQDVLVTLANSRLRIQITQVEFRRQHGIKPLTDDEKGGGSGFQRSGPVMSMMGGMGAPPRMMGASAGGGGPGAGARQMMQSQQRMMMAMGGSGQGAGGSGPGAGARQMMQSQQRMMMAMGGRGGSNPQIVGPMGGMPGTFSGTAGPTKLQDREDENLVEMTVYGIATLYRRLDPPKTETPVGQAAPPPTTAPTPGGPSR